MKAEQVPNQKHTALSPATWCAGVTLSLAAIGFTGCENKTNNNSIDKSQVDAPIVSKTPPYTYMGEGVFLITREGREDYARGLNVTRNLASWKKDHPDRQINHILMTGRYLSDGLLIDTVEKPSAPPK